MRACQLGARRRRQLVDQHAPDDRVREGVAVAALHLDQDAIANGARQVVGGRRLGAHLGEQAGIDRVAEERRDGERRAATRRRAGRAGARSPRARRAARGACRGRPRRPPRVVSSSTISPTKNGLPLVSRCSVSPSAAASPRAPAAVSQSAQCAGKSPPSTRRLRRRLARRACASVCASGSSCATSVSR